MLQRCFVEIFGEVCVETKRRKVPTYASPAGTIGAALFSSCGIYRYWLTRSWDGSRPRVAFIGLNPSTADAENNDPTVLRCLRRAIRLGFGSMTMLNLFAIRATDPKVMLAAGDPVGDGNDAAIAAECKRCSMVIAAWGVDGAHRGRDKAVVEMLRRNGVTLHCLRVTAGGFPSHPLYLPYDLEPVVYQPRCRKS